MDTEIKRKWVAALRSGKYTQGKEYLCANGKHCCLGVLWEVCGVNWVNRGHANLSPSRDGLILNEYVPLEAEIPSYDTLVRMNDTGKSFTTIADYIEQTL